MSKNPMEWMIENCVPSKEARAKEKKQVYNEGWYKKNAAMISREAKVESEALSDKYIARVLKIGVKELPQGLIKMKREQMKSKRLVEKLNETLTEVIKGEMQ